MLSIIYRAYPGISKKPIFHRLSKKIMMEICLDSLLAQLKDIPFEFVFIDDGCSAEQREVVYHRFSERASHFRHEPLYGKGNEASFAASIAAGSQAHYENVLFLEDDYYLADTDLAWNLKAIEAKEAEYSTFFYPCDAEPYIGNMSFARQIELAGGGIATPLPSTTLTFLTRKSTLCRDAAYFLAFCDGVNDCSLWLALTGSYLHFAVNFHRPLFAKNPKLYLSITKHYFRIRYQKGLRKKRRKLIFIGGGRSFHLESTTLLRKFSAPRFALERELSRKQEL